MRHRAGGKTPSISTGIDIVPVIRFKKTMERKSFPGRVFTEAEISYCRSKYSSAIHFAGKFAAKEAVSKALKLEWEESLNWKEIEILNGKDGAPFVILSGSAKKTAIQKRVTEIQISVSHSDDYAVASAVAVFLTAEVIKGEDLPP